MKTFDSLSPACGCGSEEDIFSAKNKKMFRIRSECVRFDGRRQQLFSLFRLDLQCSLCPTSGSGKDATAFFFFLSSFLHLPAQSLFCLLSSIRRRRRWLTWQRSFRRRNHKVHTKQFPSCAILRSIEGHPEWRRCKK